jgi:hypothetical protein
MADTANVQSIEAIREIRDALVIFMEDARNALNDTDFELRRTTDWLTHEQRLHWAAEVRRRSQDLTDARTVLHRKELGKTGGSRPDTSVEEKDLRIAKMRLAEAEEKVETVRKWIPEIQRASHEYRSQALPLGDMISGDLANALAKLSRMVESLEDYLRVKAPSTPQATPTGFSSSGSAGTSPAAAKSEPAATTTQSRPETSPDPGEGHSDEQQRRIEPAEPRDQDVPGEVG